MCFLRTYVCTDRVEAATEVVFVAQAVSAMQKRHVDRWGGRFVVSETLSSFCDVGLSAVGTGGPGARARGQIDARVALYQRGHCVE